MRADCLEDLTEEAVIDLLNRSTGSHKPEKYVLLDWISCVDMNFK